MNRLKPKFTEFLPVLDCIQETMRPSSSGRSVVYTSRKTRRSLNLGDAGHKLNRAVTVIPYVFALVSEKSSSGGAHPATRQRLAASRDLVRASRPAKQRKRSDESGAALTILQTRRSRADSGLAGSSKVSGLF